MFDKIRVIPGGDPEGGWLIDVHDGENSAVYNPTGATMDAAVAAALADHRKAFPKAPAESDYTPTEPAPEPEAQSNEASEPAAAPALEDTPTTDEGAAPAPAGVTEPAPTPAE